MKRYTVWYTTSNGHKTAWDVIAVSERAAKHEVYNLAGTDIEVTYIESVDFE